MACHSDWILRYGCFLWIFTWLLMDSHAKRTQTFYMEGDGCKSQRLTGATVFSHHRTANKKLFKHETECTMTFYAAIEGWKLMLRMIELDIPDRSSKGICNDAVYIYDHNSVFANGMDDAGGQGGICGNRLPPTLYSTDSVMTVHFRSDATGPRGKGFKFIITAINPAESTSSNQPMKNGTASKSKASCGLAFRCNNNWCIDKDLICDRINHCGDYSDESSEGRAKCDSVLNRFMTLGVTAAVAITVGSIVIFIVCIVAIICCCKKSACKKADPNSITTTATSVVTNGGVTPFQGKINKVGTNYVNSSQGRTLRNPLQTIQAQTLSHPNQAFNYSCQIYK